MREIYMASALTDNQKANISVGLAAMIAAGEIISEWDLDLRIVVGGINVTVYTDRSVSIGSDHIDGDAFKGSGFIGRIVDTVVGGIQQRLSPAEEDVTDKKKSRAKKGKAKPAAAVSTPGAPPKRGPRIITPRVPVVRAHPRVEIDGVVVTPRDS